MELRDGDPSAGPSAAQGTWEAELVRELRLEETLALVEKTMLSMGSVEEGRGPVSFGTDSEHWLDEHKVFWSLQRTLKLLKKSVSDPRQEDVSADTMAADGYPTPQDWHPNGGSLSADHASTHHSTGRRGHLHIERSHLRNVNDVLAVPTMLGQTNVIVGKFFVRKPVLPHAQLCYDGNTLFYNYIDVPFVGWREEVYIAARHVDISTVNVAYVPPSSDTKIWTKSDLTIFFEQHSLDPNLMKYFKDFGRVGCVCHRNMEVASERNQTVQCFYGIAGCAGFVHLSCVGIRRVKHVLHVCPLCAAYIRSKGDNKELNDKR